MASRDFQAVTELRGLALPAVRGPQGYFPSQGQFDVAWGDLLMALFTPQGGRPMRRSFGSTLYELLFEPLFDEFDIVKLVIRDTATRFCPHLLIRRVTVEVQGEAVRVGVVFSLRSDLANEQDRDVLVQKTHISALGV